MTRRSTLLLLSLLAGGSAVPVPAEPPGAPGRRAGGVAIPHHQKWALTDRTCDTNVEVTSGWAIYFRQPERIHRALDEGHRLGFVGTSDNHRRCPGLGGGLTGIFARELTPAAILEALAERRVFATTGSRIVLDSRVAGAPMGAAVPISGPAELVLRARGTGPIASATLVRDGTEIRTFPGGGERDLEIAFRDDAAPPGPHWYYWRVAQEGNPPEYVSNVKVARGNLAWSSPHWVVPRESKAARR
jgi:hypothetical protein